jgi:hypothetical protein
MCEELETVPFVVLESELYRTERREKRLCAVVVLSSIATILSCALSFAVSFLKKR